MSAPATAIPGSTQTNKYRVTDLSQEDIANLAYTLWQKRGSPDASAEQDWLEAERQLQTGPAQSSTSTNRR